MAFITLKDDKPRRLRFGFNSMAYLQSVHNISDIQKFILDMSKGHFYNFAVLIEACLSSDNEGLNTKMINDKLDDFIADHGMEKLSELITEVIEESSVFKDANKKKAKEQAKKTK